nr:uncharacterized protein K02A2.6-like [Onthophagus taurus]
MWNADTARSKDTEKACFLKKKRTGTKNRRQAETKTIDNTEEEEEKEQGYRTPINKINCNRIPDKVIIVVKINGYCLPMEVDSGAGASIIGKKTFHDIFGDKLPELSPPKVILNDYQDKVVDTLGECTISVDYKNKKMNLPIIILKNNRSSLVGRNWFDSLGISVTGIDNCIVSNTPNYAHEYPEVFEEKVGTYRGRPVSFDIDPNVKPIMMKVRKIPFALKGKIDDELNRLLREGIIEPIEHPRWGTSVKKAFNKLKELLTKEPVLAHYDENKPLVVTADASPYGVGCVLSQRDNGGEETVVAYHSHTLTTTERNFAQIDREALALAVKKFHDYCYGRTFELRTDHKPLLGILGKNKPTPEILSPRMLRWTIILNVYNYSLQYIPGKQLANADALSRLPLKAECREPPRTLEVLMLENLPEKMIEAKDIASATAKDPILSRIREWIWKGWHRNPKEVYAEFQPFVARAKELSCYMDCILWGTRVVIPPGGRKEILELLHASHPGIVKMKALARSYVWWPGIHKQIEEKANTCMVCQETRNMPAKAPLHPWEWAKAPWSRLHLDFAGPVKGRTFLITIDAYSKWLEVHTTSSAATISVLRQLFATHGSPEIIVSDNGTAFICRICRLCRI